MYLNLNRSVKAFLFYSMIYFYNLFLMFHVNHFAVFHFIWLSISTSCSLHSTTALCFLFSPHRSISYFVASFSVSIVRSFVTLALLSRIHMWARVRGTVCTVKLDLRFRRIGICGKPSVQLTGQLLQHPWFSIDSDSRSRRESRAMNIRPHIAIG